MPKIDANVVLYVVDLDELRAWVGCGDQRKRDEAWEAIQEDEEWAPDALEMLQELLDRVVMRGQLYGGLGEAEKYLVTQILVDVFDEFIDQDAISEDMPLDRFLPVVEGLPKGSEAARFGKWLARGRELDGDGLLWAGSREEFVSPYFGFVKRDEAPRFLAGLDAAIKQERSRPSGILKQLRAAVDECARAELDLLAYVG